jgi:hypothetical protein
MSGSVINLNWLPPGPVAARFMASDADVHILNGPVGSGKTTTALMKAIRLGARQAPSTLHTGKGARGETLPLRRFRVTVVRDTYRQLWRSTLPSWFGRVPRDQGEFVGSQGAPATHKVTFGLPDKTLLEFIADFVAIGDEDAETVLRGYETSCFYLNEMDMLAKEVFDYARTRTGRFPSMQEGGPTWHGIIADCNAPDLNSWMWGHVFNRSAAELAAEGIELFRQPGGLDPQAENLPNLVRDYYAKMVRGMPEWLKRRMVDNIPGYSRNGKPVYPEFNDPLHVPAQDLDHLPGLLLMVGLDAGLHPAAVIGQRTPTGQWRILDELCGEPGMGAIRFGDMLAQRLRERFAGVMEVQGWADPSAAYGHDKAAGEASWIEVVAARTGMRVRAAPTNALSPRLEAVRLPLTRLVDGKPGLLLSPRCKVLRGGFAAEYRFRRMNVSGERYDDLPDKGDASHPHDALQYLCSGGGENAEIRARVGEDRKRTSRMPTQLPTGYSY